MAAERDTAMIGHDSAHKATRSPSLTRPTRRTSINKRSPSPIVTLHSQENGVKGITRKVIKRLEGLGHLDELEADSPSPEDEEMESDKVPDVLAASNGHSNGNGHSAKAAKVKVDYEIPRKVLHSSIGFLTTYLYISEGSVPRVVLVLWTALAVIVPADLLRFNSRRFASLYERLLGFLMRESEKNSVNGVVWYILGVNCVLALLPQDVATVAILILSWADTAASTFGRLYGSATRKLPARLPLLGLPLAPRKSFAGFAAATITGALIAVGFWGFVAPLREGGAHLTWTWEGGVRNPETGASLGGGGALGLLALSVVAGLVSGVAEALDLGSLDDNLTLPIISGGCLFGFLKLLGAACSWFSS